ncbi:MAG: hypothetical protein JO307_14310 [Bryobacterales bacterium]|nr:hypothetical protein [Bryobacterales bacterium]MBV9399545.1 hypothetical protein [Bryobacterales bacterium]
MARRSTQITLQNNTDLDLTMVSWHLCHGSWTNDVSPPSTIPNQSTASWESESSGIATGTEGWVKYQITNPTSCVPELVYIYWDNPFVWANDTQAVNYSVTTTDVNPPCDGGQWDTPGGFPHGGTNPPECTHVLFGISCSGGSPQGITWWDVAVNWPALLGLTVLGQADINLQFTIGLGLKGSVRQMFGTEDILAIARTKGQPSLRALMHL